MKTIDNELTTAEIAVLKTSILLAQNELHQVQARISDIIIQGIDETGMLSETSRSEHDYCVKMEKRLSEKISQLETQYYEMTKPTLEHPDGELVEHDSWDVAEQEQKRMLEELKATREKSLDLHQENEIER